jgi:hypothetical protein
MDEQVDSKSMELILSGDKFPSNWGFFLDTDICVFFDNLFLKTGLRKSDVIRKANLPRTFTYQLLNGKRHGPCDYYLLIALAMSLDLSTTRRMLAVTKSGALHPLIKRDAAIIYSINHGYDPNRAYEFMCGVGVPPLDSGIEIEED